VARFLRSTCISCADDSDVVSCLVLQVVMWLNQNFLLVDEYHTDSLLDVSFLCLRSLPQTRLLVIRMDHNGQVLRHAFCLFVHVFMHVPCMFCYKFSFAKLSTYRRRTFAISVPRIWNSLPDYQKDSELSIDIFKRYLKPIFRSLLTTRCFSALETL